MSHSSKAMPLLSGQKILAGVITLLVIIAIVAGIVMIGSPMEERVRRTDEQRVSNLQQISYAVDQYGQTQGALPASMADIAKQPDVYIQRIADPETGVPYRYTVLSETSYQLCATFHAPTKYDDTMPGAVPAELMFWNHGAGETCYTLDAEDVGVRLSQPLPESSFRIEEE
ncbi:MAG: hypothetical protein RL141_418 [Candidatus Parcubacteria bacterium]|jgi:type II secretory pathway pseudopilin PulG